MFPWLPFFMFPKRKKACRRRKCQPNLLEEILEVRTIATSAAVVEQSGRSDQRMRIPFKIIFNIATNQDTEVSLLPKAPSQHLKIDFDVSKAEETDAKKNGGDVESCEELPNLSSDLCKPIPSTSSSSSSSRRTKRSGKHSSASSGQLSEKYRTSEPLTTLSHRRSAFETSHAMREIFDGDSLFKQLQERHQQDVKNIEKQDANPTRLQQLNNSENGQSLTLIETATISPTNLKCNIEANINEDEESENHVLTTSKKLKNVARVAPFAYFPLEENTEQQRTASKSQKVEVEKEAKLPIEDNEGEKQRAVPFFGRKKFTNAGWKPNGLTAEERIIETKSTGKTGLPGYQNKGDLQLIGESKRLQNIDQAGKADPAEIKTDTNKDANARISGSWLGGENEANSARKKTTSSSDEPLEMSSANEAASGVGMETKQILIRNALIVNDDQIFKADVLIANGIIKEIFQGNAVVEETDQQIDANGKCLLPAGIDVHTTLFLDKAVAEDKVAMDTKTALCGGTGTIVDVFDLPDSINDDLLTQLEQVLTKINEFAECNVGLSIAVNKWQGERSRNSMTQLVQKAGINSFILELSSNLELFEALEHARSIGALCRILLKDNDMIELLRQRLNIVEENASELEAGRIQQLCTLSSLANTPISILSLSSSAASRSLLEYGNSGGSLLSAEIPVAAFAYSKQSDCSLANVDNDLLDVLARYSNSVCVSSQINKKNAIACTGLRMTVLWEKAVLSGKMDPMRFVAVTSANAARFFNIYPKKGRIAVGSDADLVLWEFRNQSINISKKHPAPFDYLPQHAQPKTIILSGRLRFHLGTFESNNVLSSNEKSCLQLKKKFISLPPNSPYLYSIVRLREKKFDFDEFVQQHIGLMSNDAGSSNGSCNPTLHEEQQSSMPRPSSRNKNVQSETASRAATKIIHPPGGQSTALW